MLLDEYQKHNTDDRSREDIWEDFVYAINNTTFERGVLYEVNFRNSNPSYKERILRLYHAEKREGKKLGSPIYLAMLVVLVMAKAGSPATSDRAIKQAIKDFFDSEGINYLPTDFNPTNNEDYLLKAICRSTNDVLDGGLWKDINEWSIRNGKGYSFFDYTPMRYASIIAQHCLLSGNVTVTVRELYNKLGLNRGEGYSFQYFKARLMAQSRKFRYYFNNANTVKQLKTDDNLVKVLFDDFQAWDGTFEEEGSHENTIQNYYLRKCCSVDIDNGTFDIEYRIFNSITEPIKVRLSDGTVTTISPDYANWSTPVANHKITTLNNGGRYKRRFIFNSNEDDIYFVALNEEFPGNIMVSTDNILQNGMKAFFITRYVFGEDGNVLKTLPFSNKEGYKLYSYDISFDDPIMNEGILSKYKGDRNRKSINLLQLHGGLPLKNQGADVYLPFNLPQVYDYAFMDDLSIEVEGSGVKYHLLASSSTQSIQSYKIWNLPDSLNPGHYIIGGELKLIIFDNTITIQHQIDYPCFTNEGKVGNETDLIEKNVPFLKNGYVWTGDKNVMRKTLLEEDYPLTYMCHRNDVSIVADSDDFTASVGDILIEWLYYRGKCSKKEFVDVYNQLQSSFLKKSNHTYGFRYFPDANSALRWLVNGGFVDRNNGYVYANSPRMMCLPVDMDQCNKFHLVGCRSIYMLHLIQKECRKHREILAFQFNKADDIYLKYRLTPSSIFVEVKGTSIDNYGFESVCRYLCKDLLIEEPKPSIYYNITKFTPKISDLENGDWYTIDSNNYSYSDKCYIFNPEQYLYADDPLVFVELKEYFEKKVQGKEKKSDESFMLVKIEFNEYNHRYVLFDMVNFKYKEISDESLGKLFVIAKKLHFGQRNRSIIVGEDKGIIKTVDIAKRVGLPQAVSRFLNLISLYPPSYHKHEEVDGLNYYSYVINDDLNKATIKGIISKLLY